MSLSDVVVPPQVKAGLRIAKWALIIGAIIAVGVYVMTLKGEVRHLQKVNERLAGDLATAKGNLATVQGALDIQSQRLVDANREGERARQMAAQAASRVTQAQKDRATTRRAIMAPERSTGLTAAEWSQL